MSLPDELLNRENRELKASLGEFEVESDRVDALIKEHKARVQFLTNHLGNVQSEMAASQALIDAKRSEIESEEHFAAMADRMVSRYEQDLKRYGAQRDEMVERIEGVQNKLLQGNLRIDEFRKAMGVNQEELEQWDLARRQREDDAAALQRYSKADDQRGRELGLRLEKLERQVQAARRALEDEVTETQAVQIELNKTAEDFVGAQGARAELVQRLADASEAIKRRNVAIESAAARYEDGAAWLAKRSEALRSESAFHAAEQEANAAVEARTKEVDKALADLRADSARVADRLRALEDELAAKQNEVAGAVRQLDDTRARHEAAVGDLNSKTEAHTRAVKRHAATAAKLKEEAELAHDLHKQSAMVDALHSEAAAKTKDLEKELALLKEQQFVRTKELKTAREDEGTLVVNVQGAQAQARQLAAAVARLDGQAFKQQELLYSIQYQVQVMERSVARAKGERTPGERAELQAKIDSLTVTLDEMGKQRRLLEQQVRRVDDELRQAAASTAKAQNATEKESERILELSLGNDTLANEVGRLSKQRRELLVTRDVLALHLSRLRTVLQERAKELHGLEHRKVLLSLTVEERMAEIKAHHEGLLVELREAEGERRRVALEVQDRGQAVRHLKTRFGLTVDKFRTEGDDPDGDLTQAQLMLKLAKEKDDLQARGDALDEEVRQLEAELRKVEHMKAMLRACNADKKASLRKADPEGPEADTRKALTEQRQQAVSKANRRAADMQTLMREQVLREEELMKLSAELDESSGRLRVMRAGYDKLEEEIAACDSTIARASQLAAALQRKIGKALADDIEVRELRAAVEETSKAVLRLPSAAQDHAYAAAVMRVFGARGVQIPADRPSSARSVNTSSCGRLCACVYLILYPPSLVMRFATPHRRSIRSSDMASVASYRSLASR